MIFFLLLGAVLGAAFIIFVLQNVTPITVTFFTYHLSGSLSIILLLSLVSGMLITVLILLPGLIRDEFRVRKLKKENNDLANELEVTKNTLHEATINPTVVEVPAEPSTMLY